MFSSYTQCSLVLSCTQGHGIRSKKSSIHNKLWISLLWYRVNTGKSGGGGYVHQAKVRKTYNLNDLFFNKCIIL